MAEFKLESLTRKDNLAAQGHIGHARNQSTFITFDHQKAADAD